MTQGEGELRALVRRVIGSAMAGRGRPRGRRPGGVHVEVRSAKGPDRPLEAAEPNADASGVVCAADLADIPDGGALPVPRGAQITPLAQEEAYRRRIQFSSSAAARAGSQHPPKDGPLRVAVGCDHGGLELKLGVLTWLRELGHRGVDLGTHDENPVDYPDIAQKAARAVSEGQVDLAVLIDGAGIGSAMAANKVPGVRAANCHDPKMAANAREHNYANVLTLGAGMVDEATAHAVLRTFLSTPWGAARHGRRVDKITALEGRAKSPSPPS